MLPRGLRHDKTANQGLIVLIGYPVTRCQSSANIPYNAITLIFHGHLFLAEGAEYAEKYFKNLCGLCDLCEK